MSHIQPPSERFETTVSHGLFSGKDMLMETDIHAKEQEEMVVPPGVNSFQLNWRKAQDPGPSSYNDRP